MPAMSLSVVPCNHRWTDNVLVPEVPEHWDLKSRLTLGCTRPDLGSNEDCNSNDARVFGSGSSSELSRIA
jgi:hypothetical protein